MKTTTGIALKGRCIKIFLCLSLLLLFNVNSVSAAPLAESYGYVYNTGEDSWSSVYSANTYIDSMGYNGNAYKNTSAYYVRRTMGDDALFFIYGHAAPGKFQCWNGSTTTYLTGDASSDNSAYSLEALFQGTTQLRDLKLAVFLGCTSANNSTTYGNLITKSSELGVDVAMGWRTNIEIKPSNYYAWKFYYYLNQGYTIWKANDLAIADATLYVGFNSLKNYAFAGAGDPTVLKMKPAAYGTN